MKAEKKRWTENFVLGIAVLVVALCAGVFGIGGSKASDFAEKPLNYYEQSMAADFTGWTGAQPRCPISGGKIPRGK